MTSEDEPANTGTDVYKEYVWKLIYHKGHKAHGIYLEVQFEDSNRAGQTVARYEYSTLYMESDINVINHGNCTAIL